MKKSFILALVSVLMCLGTSSCMMEEEADAADSDPVVWLEDFAIAKKQAVERNMPILMYFTGSDWCPPCMQLDRDVFSKQIFKEWADQNVVLLKLDFPHRILQSPDQQRHNERIRDDFRVEGYPTIILIDSKGNRIAQTGFRRGGAKKYITHLEGLLINVKK